MIPSPALGVGLTCQDIQDGIRQRHQALGGRVAKFDLSAYLERPGVANRHYYDETYELTLKGRKLRMDRDHFDPPGTWLKKEQVAWDGGRLTTTARLDNGPGKKHNVSGGVEAAKNGVLSGYWQTLFEGRVFDYDMTLPDMFDLPAVPWEAIGFRVIAGRTAWGIRASGKGGAGIDGTLEVWVDPLRDFAPVEMSVGTKLDDGRSPSITMTEVELARPGAVWLPMAARIAVTHDAGSGKGSHEVLKVKHCEVGIDVPDDVFVLKFPDGMDVWDDVAKLSYTVGRGVWVTGKEGRVKFVETGHIGAVDDDFVVPSPAGSQRRGGAVHSNATGSPHRLRILGEHRPAVLAEATPMRLRLGGAHASDIAAGGLKTVVEVRAFSTTPDAVAIQAIESGNGRASGRVVRSSRSPERNHLGYYQTTFELEVVATSGRAGKVEEELVVRFDQPEVSPVRIPVMFEAYEEILLEPARLVFVYAAGEPGPAREQSVVIRRAGTRSAACRIVSNPLSGWLTVTEQIDPATGVWRLTFRPHATPAAGFDSTHVRVELTSDDGVRSIDIPVAVRRL